MTMILSGLATRVWMKCDIMEVEFKIEIFLRFPLKLSYFKVASRGLGLRIKMKGEVWLENLNVQKKRMLR